MFTYQIYVLVDPKTLLVRYVGRTVQPLAKRLKQHRYAKRRSHVTSWIQALRAANLTPSIELLETLSDEGSWYEAERWWINYGRLSGWQLTNHTDGGDGQPPVRVNSLTANEKVSAALRGRSKSEKHRQRLSQSHRRPELVAANQRRHLGRKRSEATKARIGLASKGRTPSETSRSRMSASHVARWTQIKADPAYQSRPVSEETKARMSAAHKARWAQIKAANPGYKGKPASDETKARMSAAHKARWEQKRRA